MQRCQNFQLIDSLINCLCFVSRICEVLEVIEEKESTFRRLQQDFPQTITLMFDGMVWICLIHYGTHSMNTTLHRLGIQIS